MFLKGTFRRCDMRGWLRDIRISKGLTQEQVAILSDISRSHYTHIEQGTKKPSVDVAKRIAKQLGFDWTIFFENKSSLKEQKQVI